METKSISFKIYMDKGQELDPEVWFRVFNTWIPQPDDDILVDVADYSHVKNGPVTILVGHKANYALDNTDGRFGFQYTRKRDLQGSFADDLETTIREGLKAAARLDTDPALDGGVHFTGERTQVVLNDRLNTPNTDDTEENIKADVDAFLSRLYAGGSAKTQRNQDARQRFTLDIEAEGTFSPSQLLENIDS